jgi:hypothetical protein
MSIISFSAAFAICEDWNWFAAYIYFQKDFGASYPQELCQQIVELPQNFEEANQKILRFICLAIRSEGSIIRKNGL